MRDRPPNGIPRDFAINCKSVIDIVALTRRVAETALGRGLLCDLLAARAVFMRVGLRTRERVRLPPERLDAHEQPLPRLLRDRDVFDDFTRAPPTVILYKCAKKM